MQAGRLVAVYAHDGQGRRLLLVDRGDRNVNVDAPLIAAFTQAEARALIATVTQLLEELPP
jgi:hypothetical protein